jgi:hypothetical protein
MLSNTWAPHGTELIDSGDATATATPSLRLRDELHRNGALLVL